MTNNYQELTAVAREFKDISTDLLNSNYKTFNSHLNFFKTICNESGIIQEILNPIVNNNYNVQNWYQQATNSIGMVGSGDPTLPVRKIDALTVIYHMLWNENAQKLIENFTIQTMYSKQFDEMLRKYNASFTNQFIRYILRELENKIEMVKPQAIPYGNTFNTFNGPTNYATNSHSVNQNIQINNPDLIEVINQMREVVDRSTLSLTEKQDALETIEMIENEVSKEKPSPTKVQKMLALLPTVDSLASLADTLIANLPI